MTNRSVVMVCSQMPPLYGGAGKQATLLGQRLADLGWEVTAVTLDQAKVGSRVEGGIKFRRVLPGVAAASRGTRLLTTVALGAAAFLIIMKMRPAVVHIHGAYWWSVPPAIAGRLVRAVVVVKLTCDGEDDAHTVYAKRIGRLKVGRLYGISLSIANAVIALNQRAANIANEEGLGQRVRLIPNGVDDKLLKRTQSARDAARQEQSLGVGDRVVIFVGFLVKRKGLVDLLQAWRILDDRQAQLWLVGPFDGFYRDLDEDDIPRMIAELISDGFRIRQFGLVSSEELATLYWAADVFTLPSYAEGMPNSLAEALVAGCEIVATRIPGIIETMDWDLERLVTPGDVLGLSARLTSAMTDAKPAPKRVIDGLRISKIAGIYDGLYTELGRK